MTSDGRGGPLLVPRNFASLPTLWRHDFLLMPQYVIPWTGPWGQPREALRNGGLRVLSDLSAARASGIVRISSAVPHWEGKSSRPVPNVIDPEFESAFAASSGFWTDAAGAVVCAGSIITYKNLERVLLAFERYKRAGGQLRLVIHGPILAKSYMDRLRRQAVSLPDVELRPGLLKRPYLLASLRDCALALFPAVAEASPIGLLEALCLSEQIAASDIVGHREIASGNLPDTHYFDPHDISAIEEVFMKAEHGALGVQPPESLATSARRDETRRQWAATLVAELEKLLTRKE